MKKESFVLLLLLCCSFVSCWHHREDISIEYSESDHYYFMDARFGENQAKAVEEYLDYKIGRRNNMSFANTQIDGRLSLDDHTTFFIKKSGGHLEIELDKRKNSLDSYRKVKSLCEGIKGVLK